MSINATVTTAQRNDLRYPFSRQPTPCLIVDLTSDFTHKALQEVCSGIANFFSIACSMSSGPTRVPYFSMLVMTPYTEIIFPVQRISRSSFCRIETALNEMMKLFSDGNVQTSKILDIRSLEHSIRDAASQFQKIKQAAGSLSKMELTIISCHPVHRLRKAVIQALSRINLTDVRQVIGMCLIAGEKKDEELEKRPFEADSSEELKENFSEDCTLDLTGILNVFAVDCDSMSIESAMRNWLNDRTTDREHLQICFNTIEIASKTTIKCDIRERLIDISEFPSYRQGFEMVLDGNESFQHSQATQRTVPKPINGVPINMLRVIKRVPLSSICESVLFGRPLVVSSSNCWKMEWDELESNQNYFNALCRSLTDTHQAIICENITPALSTRRNSRANLPQGLFLIIASQKLGSLLLKSICSQELLLAAHVPTHPQWDVIPNDAFDKINTALNSVEMEVAFNPMLLDSGLLPALKSNLREQGRSILPNKKIQNQNCGWYNQQNVQTTTKRAARFAAPSSSRRISSVQSNQRSDNASPKSLHNRMVTFSDFPSC